MTRAVSRCLLRRCEREEQRSTKVLSYFRTVPSKVLSYFRRYFRIFVLSYFRRYESTKVQRTCTCRPYVYTTVDLITKRLSSTVTLYGRL